MVYEEPATFTFMINLKNYIGVLGVFVILLIFPYSTKAASLYFSASSLSYQVGSEFSVEVDVGSADQTMNAVSGVIIFPKEQLEVRTISKTGSIVNFWTVEPSFSNAQGFVNFEGIVLNPGFKGSLGKIMTITFHAMGSGNGLLGFSSGSVLANDGKGTMILNQLKNLQLVLLSPLTLESVASSNTLLPKIFSSSHPDSSKWYRNANPEFTWALPFGVTALKISYDNNAVGLPQTLSIPALSHKSFTNVSDGVWFLHAQFRTADGWGPIGNFRFQIDTTPPVSPVIIFPHGKETDDPRPVVFFNTTDKFSGVDHYEIKIGDRDLYKIRESEIVQSNPYALPSQEVGNHSIVVLAYDSAGNSAATSDNFVITPIHPPSFVSLKNDFSENQIWTIEGSTYPYAFVQVYLNHNGVVSSNQTKSNALGFFSLVWPDLLTHDTYEYWGKVTDEHGAISADSEHFKLDVKLWGSSLDYLNLGFIVIPTSLLAIGSSAILLIFLLLLFFERYRMRRSDVLYKTEGVSKVGKDLERDIPERLKRVEEIRAKLQNILEEEEQMLQKDIHNHEVST